MKRKMVCYDFDTKTWVALEYRSGITLNTVKRYAKMASESGCPAYAEGDEEGKNLAEAMVREMEGGR